jgi:lactoylglutathione lyase
LFGHFVFYILVALLSVMTQTEKKPIFLNHIAVHVSDLQRAADFYSAVFDLESIPEPFKLGRHAWFSLGAAGQLHLIQNEKSSMQHDKHDHICFSVSSIEMFIQKLEAMQVAYENWEGDQNTVHIRVDGIKQIFFKDPDGHWLEVNNDY